MTEVLLRDELVRRVGGRRAFDACLRAGDWRRVMRGAYAPGDAALDLELRCAAAQRLRARTTLLPPADRAVLRPSGLRTLRTGRACADLLRRLPLPEAVVVADASQRAELISRGQLEDEAGSGRAGAVVAQVAAVLAARAAA
jgi:hypothetical protein